MKKISMIVPCYNEEENVNLFFEDAIRTYKDSKKYKLELVFIDDGSSDNTLMELKKIAKTKDCTVKIISFSRNFGKESVIFAGLKAATGDYTVLIDADMQQPPRMTLKMAEMLDSDDSIDCVCYYQEKRIESKFMIFIKSIFYKMINKMSDTYFKQGASDFRMFRKSVRESILLLEERCRFTKGIFSWVGFNTSYIPYTPLERANGKSKWSPYKLFRYAVLGIVSFSTVPLRLATFMGCFVSFLAILYAIIVLYQKLFLEIAIPGYATIVLLILIIGGIQLFCIGIIGEYMSRLYLESKNRPIYIVKEEVSNDK